MRCSCTGRAASASTRSRSNFAQALLCEAPRPDGLACGECPGCRYAVAGQHPDLMRLELLAIDPDDGDAGRASRRSRIDRVRALTDFVQLTSHRQRAKVAVIAPAERMNAAAANALLKTLEEPPAGTYLILVCRPAGAPAADDSLALPQARGAAADARRGPRLAGGAGCRMRPNSRSRRRPARRSSALAHADPGVQAERRAWLAALLQPERLSVQALAARIDAGGKDERKARLARALDWLIAWTADLARVAAGRRGAAESGRRRRAAAGWRRGWRRSRCFAIIDRCLRQRALLAHPLQPRLVAEALLIDYRALF